MTRPPTRRRALSIAAIIILILGLATLIALDAYFLNWSWTGFRPKTLWDWLDLLVIPVTVAAGGWWFSRQERRYAEQLAENRRKDDLQIAENRRKDDLQIAENRSQDEALQAYLDKMTELLLKENLRTSAESDEVRSVAHARTLTVLSRLGRDRRIVVLRFLTESGLTIASKPIINFIGGNLSYDFSVAFREQAKRGDLKGADLQGACLDLADLRGVNLEGANLNWAFLQSANLERANLQVALLLRANLERANLERANLRGAVLLGANLQGATLFQANLEHAHLQHAHLQGARYNGETRWPDGFDPQAAGAILDGA